MTVSRFWSVQCLSSVCCCELFCSVVSGQWVYPAVTDMRWQTLKLFKLCKRVHRLQQIWNMKWTWTGWVGSSVWYTFCHQVSPLTKSSGPWPKSLQTGKFWWFELQLSSSSDRSFVLDSNLPVLNVELKFREVQICTRTTCVSPVRRIIQKHTWMEDGSLPRTEPINPD